MGVNCLNIILSFHISIQCKDTENSSKITLKSFQGIGIHCLIHMGNIFAFKEEPYRLEIVRDEQQQGVAGSERDLFN